MNGLSVRYESMRKREVLEREGGSCADETTRERRTASEEGSSKRLLIGRREWVEKMMESCLQVMVTVEGETKVVGGERRGAEMVGAKMEAGEQLRREERGWW
ncbi:hypothetical protein AMTR_s00167p00047730 [Amborella trichopoda]|uniref:Uncharacterized protein n=1 Tax=Amborella trichopoda TaxID=13333 RepID=W1PLJ9_AMBTC|nr:hypothetical protein AMTR_s00167p00047730 [Amborella trichopoda]